MQLVFLINLMCLSQFRNFSERLVLARHSSVGVVKMAPRALKIGVQSRFYPISTVGFRTFFPENFGQAYSTVVPGFRVLGFSALPGFRALKAGDGAWSVHKTLFGFSAPLFQHLNNDNCVFFTRKTFVGDWIKVSSIELVL